MSQRRDFVYSRVKYRNSVAHPDPDPPSTHSHRNLTAIIAKYIVGNYQRLPIPGAFKYYRISGLARSRVLYPAGEVPGALGVTHVAENVGVEQNIDLRISIGAGKFGDHRFDVGNARCFILRADSPVPGDVTAVHDNDVQGYVLQAVAGECAAYTVPVDKPCKTRAFTQPCRKSVRVEQRRHRFFGDSSGKQTGGGIVAKAGGIGWTSELFSKADSVCTEKLAIGEQRGTPAMGNGGFWSRYGAAGGGRKRAE